MSDLTAGLPATPGAGNPRVTPAPWLDLAGVVDEVKNLRRRFEQPDLRGVSVLCDEHSRDGPVLLSPSADPSCMTAPCTSPVDVRRLGSANSRRSRTGSLPHAARG